MVDLRLKQEEFARWLARLDGHLPSLDGLRALAILLVIWHNTGIDDRAEIGGIPLKVYQLVVNTGWVGVQLFFVLSGFLITGILLAGKGRENQLRNFYFRRMLRIFPLYYTFLVLAFLVLPSVPDWSNLLAEQREQQFWYWVYLVNWIQPFQDMLPFTHFWSLAIEEQFYLLWPLLVVFLPNSRIREICLVLIFTAILSRIVLVYLFGEAGFNAAYTFTIARWDGLAFGALLALMTREEKGRELLEAWSGKLFVLLSVLLIAQVAVFESFVSRGTGYVVLNQTLAGLWFALALFLGITERGNSVVRRYQAWLGLPVLRILAKYSYAIYIFHLPLYKLWPSGINDAIVGLKGIPLLLALNLNCLAVLVLSLLLAMISWRLIEAPCLGLKKYFPSRSDD